MHIFTIFLTGFILLFTFSFTQDRDCAGLNQDECHHLDYCLWTEEGCISTGDHEGNHDGDGDWPAPQKLYQVLS